MKIFIDVCELFDAAKSSSHELPECNWLEDNIYDSQLAKRAQECRRWCFVKVNWLANQELLNVRQIEIELSRRKSISNRSENTQNEETPSIQNEQTLMEETNAFSNLVVNENDGLTFEPENCLTETPVPHANSIYDESLRWA